MAFNYTGSAGMSGATVPTVPGNMLNLMIAAARMTPQLEGNVTTLVFNDPLPPGKGTTYNSPQFGTFDAFSASDGEEAQNWQSLSSTNVVVTPGEVTVQTAFTKKSLAEWTENMVVRAGEIMRRTMDRKKDADITGLFTSLDLSVGSAGHIMSIGHLAAAVARLTGGANTASSAIAAGTGINVTEEGPFHGVFRPESLASLLKETIGGAAFTGTLAKTSMGVPGGGVADDMARRGVASMYDRTLAGVDLYRCANIAKDSSDDAIGAVFVEGAMIFVPFSHPGAEGGVHVAETDDGRILKLTYCEDYGFGELDGTMGVKVTVDASPISS